MTTPGGGLIVRAGSTSSVHARTNKLLFSKVFVPARKSPGSHKSPAVVARFPSDGARSRQMAPDDASSREMAPDAPGLGGDRRCAICQQPMTGTATARRGRPQRTHAGRCKRIIDVRHRAAARAERFAVQFAVAGNQERAAKAVEYARRLRASCGDAR